MRLLASNPHVYNSRKRREEENIVYKVVCASVKRPSCVDTTIFVTELLNYEIQVSDRVDPGHSLATKLFCENPDKC